MLASRVLNEWFTGRDNSVFELGRALWAFGTLSLILFQGVALFYKGQPFSPVEFGTGLALILAAGGFGVAVKDKAEKPVK